MVKEKQFYWIKVNKDFLTSEKVDFLMSQKDGANYVVLYQCLCLKTINTGGELANKIGEIIIPFDEEKIQRDCKWFTIDTIRVALELYRKLGLVYVQENGILRITDFENIVGSETYWARIKRKEKQQLLESGQKVENIPPYKDIDDRFEIVACNSTEYDWFLEKYNIYNNNNDRGQLNSDLINMDFNKLDEKFSESKFLRERFKQLKTICNHYNEIIHDIYKDNKQEINKDDLWEKLDNALMWVDACKQDLKYDSTRQSTINKITSYFEKLPENVKSYVGSKWYDLVDFSNKRRDFEKARFFKEIK